MLMIECVCAPGWGAAQDFGELEQSIRAVLSHGGLQQPGSFVTKVIQLYDTMNVRFGVMLVGPTGGGKTECYRTLQVSGPSLPTPPAVPKHAAPGT